MDKKGTIAAADVLKIFGGLAVFIPLMSGIFQYRQVLSQDMDKNFRSVVEKLSSSQREERLASASNMGTFITERGRYYEQALDLLLNRLPLELDYNVLSAIRGSLDKVGQENYRRVMEKMLTLNRSLVDQEYVLKLWRDNARRAFEDSIKRHPEISTSLDKLSLLRKTLLEDFQREMRHNWETFRKRENDLSELYMHQQVVADFTATFLEVTRKYPIKNIEFRRNTLNRAILEGLDLQKAAFIGSALSSSAITESKFDGSTIINTIFTRSVLRDTSFARCTIKISLFEGAVLQGVIFSGSVFEDAFFTGSDLTGARFEATEGLKPIYFYKAKNIEKAVFDQDFKKKLLKELETIDDAIFAGYVQNESRLTNQRRDQLLDFLN